MSRKHNKRFIAARLFDFKPDEPTPITDISPDVWQLMIYNFSNGMPPPKGLFIVTQSPFRFTAVDNSTGQIQVKDFDNRFAAERWLRRDKL